MPRTLPPHSRALRRALLHGHELADATWRARHQRILRVVGAHVPLLVAVDLAMGEPPWHAAGDAPPVAVLGLLASTLPGRRARTVAASLALPTCSAVLVQATGGSPRRTFTCSSS